MKKVFLTALVGAGLLMSNGCGGGGGGGGGGNHVFHHSVFVQGFVEAQYVWHNWISLSWTAGAASTAQTMRVGNYLYSIGLPISALGFAIQWYSRTNTYNWNGLGDPPHVVDDNFTVASALTDRYFNDLNNPNNNIPMQGFFYDGWPDVFNAKAIQLIQSGAPIVARLYRGTFQQFVAVRGISWDTDSVGNLIAVTGLYIYDPSGLLPNLLTPANSVQLGVGYLGFAWMERIINMEGQSQPSDGKAHGEGVKLGGTDSTSWPGTTAPK